MHRPLRFVIFLFVLAAFAGATLVLSRSEDPLYTFQEWLGMGRYAKYDPLIETAAREHGLDPMLIKALIWRESRFYPDKTGKAGERGLMQIMPAAASEWAKAQKIASSPDLFQPETNVAAGSWYLKQALQRWRNRDEPVVFALAEYNAGRSRVERWVTASNMGERATANDLKDHISFPGTRRYVEEILDRQAFYKRRGRM